MVPPTAIAEAPRSGGEPAIKDPVKDTILTPRFYTTDFEAMAAMDLRPNQEELEAICEEFRKDYNRHHFVRNEAFDGAADKLDPETRRVFVECLEQSCTSEFSGFLLYKELSLRIKQKNPLLAECFAHMARDEARHAGFLNKAMGDFGVQRDLGFLTANKARVMRFSSIKNDSNRLGEAPASATAKVLGAWMSSLVKHTQKRRSPGSSPRICQQVSPTTGIAACSSSSAGAGPL